MKAFLWFLALVAAVAGGVYYYRADVGAAPPQLVFAQVSRGDVVATVDATGTLQTVDRVEVGTQVSGTISSLGVDFNDAVKRGQVVATLDQAIFLSQIQQVEAQVIRLGAEKERSRVQLLDAETKLGRARNLLGRQLVPITEVEAAEVAVELAKATLKASEAQLSQTEGSLAQAKVNLSYTVIRSPVDGIVLSRNVDVGQTVSAGLQAPTLFIIARSLETLELAAAVAESDVGRVQQGQVVTFTVDAYPQATFAGTVRQVRLQPTVQQNVVSYTTIIDVPNPGARLKPGMTATLSIEVARADDVLRVAASAIRFRPTDEVLLAFNGPPEAASEEGAAAPARSGSSQEPPTGETGAGRGGVPQASAPGAGQTGRQPPGVQDQEGGAGGGQGRGGFPGAGGQRPGSQGGDGPRSGMRGNGQGPSLVWQLVDGRLVPMRVRAGLSDGTTVAILGGQLVEGAQVVTSAITAPTTAAAPSTGSPLVPAMGRGRRGGPR